MRLGDLVDDVGALGIRGDDTIHVSGVTHDSRRVSPGDLFCCVPGSVDGHDFAASAVEAGASALLLERWLDLPVPQVMVARVRDVMGKVAARAYRDPSRQMLVLGVTGTNGKTTTTYLLEAVGRAAGLVPGVVGTIETRVAGVPRPGQLTTPEAPDLQALFAEMRDQGVGLVAMEVSSHALALGRVNGTWFAASTFLNLSHDHLDFHGSLDAYFAAKAGLFVPERTGTAAVNVGDARGEVLARKCRDAGVPVVSFSTVGTADIAATDMVLSGNGTEFTLVGPSFGVEQRLRSSLLGAFNVENLLAAAATSLAAGLSAEAVVAGLEAEVKVPGRFERVDSGQDFTAVVDYAHTPDALANALRAARGVATGRVLVVFGCGGDRDRAKRPEMGRVAVEEADAVYVTSDNPRSEDPEAIVAAILDGTAGHPVTVETDRRAAIATALRDARPGDVVVIAGKGHEQGQIVGSEIRPFDDRRVVVEEFESMRVGPDRD